MDALPSRKNIRLTSYDYASPGAYFVTICVNHRKPLLWERVPTVGAATCRPKTIPLSKIGTVVDHHIREIPRRYPHISVDTYCIMPDHVHLLLTIHADENGRQIAAPTLSVVIGQLKRCVSMHIGFSLWQRSFSDHVLRNEKGYQAVWQYINNNPLYFDCATDPIHFENFT